MSSQSDFTVVKQLGQGMGGICNLARRNADKRLYALKELHMPNDPNEASAVIQEVHILASLQHPFIVRYFDSFVERSKLFLVMEYAPNGSLATVLAQHQRTHRPIAEDTIWRYALQLLLGLHTIHQRRVVHRDIKPHNIFLGADDTVKIGDFGVSRVLSETANLATTLVGSPGYLAPELCSGDPYNEKADIWALGVTLVELCALKHPFGGAGSQAALVMKIMSHSGAPTLPSSYTPQLARLLSTCMARAASNRPTAVQLLSVPLVHAKAIQHQLLHLLPQQALDHVANVNARNGGAAGGGGGGGGGGGPPHVPPRSNGGAGGPPPLPPSSSIGGPPPPYHAPAAGPLERMVGNNPRSSYNCGSGARAGAPSCFGNAAGVSRSLEDDRSPPLGPVPGNAAAPSAHRMAPPFQKQTDPYGRPAAAPYASSQQPHGGYQQAPPVPPPPPQRSRSDPPPPPPQRSRSDPTQQAHGLSIAIPESGAGGGESDKKRTGSAHLRRGGTPGAVVANYNPHQEGRLQQHFPLPGGAGGINAAGLAGVREDDLYDVGYGGQAKGAARYGGGGGGGGRGGAADRTTASNVSAGGGGAAGETTRSTASGCSWSIKPVCASSKKSMQKSWGASASGNVRVEPANAHPPPPPPPQQQPLSPTEQRAPPPYHMNDMNDGRRRLSQGRGGEGGGGGRLSMGAANRRTSGGHSDLAPPSTPPPQGTTQHNLWAKRRGSNEISPSALPEKLQLVSLNHAQWGELQSPLDAFQNKHCPHRPDRTRSTQSTTASSAASGNNVGAGGGNNLNIFRACGLFVEADEEGDAFGNGGPESPSWDRGGNNNHSPLAALLRREFPVNAGGMAGAVRGSERRLFEDL